MAINTATTTLKYTTTCPLQLETATILVTSVTVGNATITVTGKDIVGSPLATSVAVAGGDTATAVAGKVITALNLVPAITNIYTVGGTGATVTLTRKNASNNDSTLNIASANGTSGGITTSPTSVHTTVGGTFAKLCDIMSYPDMGSTPSKLDVTDLTTGTMKSSILGLQETPDLTFDTNYDKTTYDTLVGLTANNYFLQLTFGTADGKFDWQGQIKVFSNGGGVDEVRKMTIVLSASTPIVFNIIN